MAYRPGKRRKARIKMVHEKYYWHKRLINEMKQNKLIQKKILDGTFDKYLGVM